MKKQTIRRENTWNKLQHQKNCLKPFFMVCVCVLFLLKPISAEAADGTVTAKSANIRANANTASTVLASVLEGNTVDIIGKVTAADGFIWYQIYVDAATKGFIRSDMVSTTATIPDITITTAETTQIATITGNGVWVRSEASTKTGTVLVSLEKGMNVNLLKTEGDWSKVNFVKDGTLVEGYIWADYVTLGDVDIPEEEPVVTTPETTETTDTTDTTDTTNSSDPASPEQGTYQERGGVVQKNGVRVRSEASTSASMVGSVDQNDLVTVIGETTDATGAIWYQIRFTFLSQETIGFVRGDFLVVEEVVVEEPVVEESVVEEVEEETVTEDVTTPQLQPDGSLVVAEPEEKKSNKAWIWIIQILILLVIAGTFVYLKLTDYVDRKADPRAEKKSLKVPVKKSSKLPVPVYKKKLEAMEEKEPNNLTQSVKVETGNIPAVDAYDQIEKKTVSLADLDDDDMELLFLNSENIE